MTARTDWRELLAQVPRDPFIPDTIWVDIDATDSPSGFTTLSKRDNLPRWRQLVTANEPVITQVDEGHTPAGDTGWSPSSSCSKPSLVADMLDALDLHPGHSVLEIGTGTGWNAALLCRHVGTAGQVVSVEVDPVLAAGARAALDTAGYSPLVITGDGTQGYPDAAPYDRVIATAAVRNTIPTTWLAQTRPGGLIVTPWGTDYCNGAMLTLHVTTDHSATGRFHGDLAFMRLRAHQRRFYEPTDTQIQHAEVTTTDVHGWDFFHMINNDQAGFSIGLQVPHCALTVELNKHGENHHVLELDDITTQSWARLDAHLTSPHPLIVHQLGPRRLWDEAVAAYDWWYEHDKPEPTRFGMTMTTDTQTVWLDEPSTIVRAFPLPWALPG